jgi:Zn-dependent M28 family amino/carboxypeptidase
MVGERSPGALDNASGVATVIAAARQLANHRGIGIVLTDGEELGLAGARAWAGGGGGAGSDKSNVTVLNCDGVDDVGGIQVMFSGKRPKPLLDAIARMSRTTGVAHGASRLIPGILTDSVAFADAGMQSVTFSRGSWTSLARIHTRRDDLAHLHGTGIAETATLMSATALEIGETR